MKTHEEEVTYEYRLKEGIEGIYGESIKTKGSLVKIVTEKDFEKRWKYAEPIAQLSEVVIAHGFWSPIRVEDCHIYKITTTIKREECNT